VVEERGAVEELRCPDAVEEAALAAGVDEHGRGARGRGAMREQALRGEALSGVALADDFGPGVVADITEGGDAHAESRHRNAGVRNDAAGGQLQRLGLDEPPAADGGVEVHRADQHVDHARAADDAVDVFVHRETGDTIAGFIGE
jgi:hypothetical protein